MTQQSLSKLIYEEKEYFLVSESDFTRITPHEPNEELLSVDDAFADADLSKMRWEKWQLQHGHKCPC